MEITNPNYNTMPEQVNQNTKDIAVLKNTVKTPATIYNATVEVAQDAGVINQSNITQQVTTTANAFVLDIVGKLFRIVTVENDQVYVAYCASIRGQQGEQGTPGTPADPLQIYPVGSVYLSKLAISPASLFGGSWINLLENGTITGGNIEINSDGSLDVQGQNTGAVASFKYNSAMGSGVSTSAYYYGRSGISDGYETVAYKKGIIATNTINISNMYMWERVA